MIVFTSTKMLINSLITGRKLLKAENFDLNTNNNFKYFGIKNKLQNAKGLNKLTKISIKSGLLLKSLSRFLFFSYAFSVESSLDYFNPINQINPISDDLFFLEKVATSVHTTSCYEILDNMLSADLG